MVVDPAGPACPCGRRGCWERFASGAGLGMLARQAALAGRLDAVVHLAGGDPESVRGEDVSAAAEAGDPAAQQVIREVGSWVGFGLANLACVTDPECFVLGGGLVHAGDLLFESARSTFADLVEGAGRRPAVADRAGRLRRAGGRRRRRARGAAGRAVVIRAGVVLPTFRDSPDDAFAAAEAAVAAGIDGLFCYDHLWPMGQPERPALAPFPLLGALAARFGPSGDGAGAGPYFGTLVARIGLVPDAVLAAEFRALAASGPRPGHRRPGHRRPPECGREPGLRHPVSSRRTTAGRGGRRWPAS